jgi:hypothetical protein
VAQPPAAPVPAPQATAAEPVPRRRPLAGVGNLRLAAAGAAVAYAGPSKITYQDTTSLSDLGLLAGPHRMTLHPAMQSCPPSPLFNAEQLPDHIRNVHNERLPAPAAEIYAVPGHELGAVGLLQQDGRIFVNNAVQPGYINGLLKPDSHQLADFWVGSVLKPDAEIIETDVPVGLALHPNTVYGHFLLEMLPRLHLLSKLRMFGRPLPIAVPNDCSKWVRNFVALYFDEAEIIYYHSKLQRVRAPCFVLPSMMMNDYAMHPEMNTAVEELVGRIVGPHEPPPDFPRRIYLSRSHHFRTWRGIANEAEVESTLSDLGFLVIHPQELPLARQIALYASAECIVSEFCSASHNALFAPRGAAVFCISWLNNCQSRIAALRGQPLAYMEPSDLGFIDPRKPRKERDFHFKIDCVELARQLDAFMRFSAEQRERSAEAGAAVRTG